MRTVSEGLPGEPATGYALATDGALVSRPDGDVVVPWWSFGKTVLATAALALVRDGLLALDEPCSGFPFSLRQLLRHEAGLADYGACEAYHLAVAKGEPPWTERELLERIDAGRLRYPPGGGWGYSNVGYLHVRGLIEATTGRTLGDALDRLVLQPLDITQARVAASPEDLAGVAGVAPGYHPGWVYHGLLVGSPGEAALLLDRLFSGRLLPDALLRAMRERRVVGGPLSGRPWTSPGYGLGLMIGEATDGAWLTGHTGGGPTSSIAVYRVDTPRTQSTVAVFRDRDDAGFVERTAIDIASRAG